MNQIVEAVDMLGGATDALEGVEIVRTEDLGNGPSSVTAPQPAEGSTTISMDDFIGIASGNPVPETAKAEEAKQQEAVSPETPAQTDSITELQMDTLVRDPADGQIKPFSQINGERALKPEYDRMARGRALVEANLPFIETAEKSVAAKVLLTALQGGATEEDALEAALASVGKRAVTDAQKEPEDPKPEAPRKPEGAERGSDEHSEWFLANLQYQNDLTKWEARQEVKRMAAVHKKELDDLRKEIASTAVAQSEASLVEEHNKKLYLNAVLKVVPGFYKLDQDQQRGVLDVFDRAFVANGITREYLQNNKLLEREVKGVLYDASEALRGQQVAAPQKPAPPQAPVGAAKPLNPSAATAGMRVPQDPWGGANDPYAAYRGLEQAVNASKI